MQFLFVQSRFSEATVALQNYFEADSNFRLSHRKTWHGMPRIGVHRLSKRSEKEIVIETSRLEEIINERRENSAYAMQSGSSLTLDPASRLHRSI